MLRDIERFLKATGMPWTKFGRLVAHDPRLIADMRNGRVPRALLAGRIARFMAHYGKANDGN